MRKWLLTGAALLGALSFSLLTGFDSSSTAEDVLQKYIDASKELNEVSAAMDMTADVDLAIPSVDASFGVGLDAKLDVSAVMEPLAMKEEGHMSLSLMGEPNEMDLSMYILQEEDGSISMYQKMNETTNDGSVEATPWTKTTVNGDEFKQMMEKALQFEIDPSSLPVAFELADSPADVNGTECYVLSTSVTWDELMLLAEPYLDNLPEGISAEDIQTYGALLSGLKFNVSLYVDTQSYKLARMYLDMEGSDWSMISSLISSSFGTDDEGNPIEVAMNINDLYIDAVYDYSTPVQIELPAEAASAQVQDAGSLLQMVEEAADEAA